MANERILKSSMPDNKPVLTEVQAATIARRLVAKWIDAHEPELREEVTKALMSVATLTKEKNDA